MRIPVARYPELRLLCWSRPAGAVLDGPEALAIYERNWRHVDAARLTEEERRLIGELAARYGGGVLHV